MNRDIETREIRVFSAVAKLLHFREAAEFTNMTQSQLSRIVARLEEKLGRKLLLRSTRRVELTPSGAQFLLECEDILARLERLQPAVNQMPDRLLLASPPSGMSILGPLLHDFHELRPRARISLMFATTLQQIELLLDARIHAGFVRPVRGEDGLRRLTAARLPLVARSEALSAVGLNTLVMGSERWSVAIPASHPLASEDAISLSALAGHVLVRFVFAGPDPGFQTQIEDMLTSAGVTPIWGPEASDSMSAACLASAGLGIALVPDWTRILNLPGLQIKPLRGVCEPFPLICAWSRTTRSPELQSFLRFLERRLKRKRNLHGSGLLGTTEPP